MPSITTHHSTNATKVLLQGDSGTGKTGALASLVGAGYTLRVIDLDNGLDVLRSYLTHPSSPYRKATAEMDLSERVQYVTLTETMRVIQGRLLPAKSTVWDRAVGLLNNWIDGGNKFGPVSSWGPDVVLVIDSLTMLSTAALNFVQATNGRLGAYQTSAKSNENRRDIGMAQTMIESLLQLLYDSSIRCNVVMISHIVYVDEQTGVPQLPGEGSTIRGYPSALGRALSPRIPRYFNNVLQAKTTGTGTATRHRLYTMPQGTVDLKSSAPLQVKPEYDLGFGLAEFFKDVRS